MNLWQRINYVLWCVAFGGRALAADVMLAFKETHGVSQETHTHPVYRRGGPTVAHWVDNDGKVVTK